MKKHIALAIAAVLSLALVAPVSAQPFADVPAEHWAFDAIAELAAKGILEGYPDGTFKGDRAMTRYEMAMALARILARIEAIKIPPPPKIPPPEVRRADIDRLQRLINEFRAELSALGVRITAIEEQLAAIKARLDNTKVTGDMRFRYNLYPSGTPSGSATFREPDVRMRARLTFTGQVSSDVSAVVRLWAANNAGDSNLDVRFGNTVLFNNVSFDYLYLNVRTAFGLPVSWRVGRQPVSLGGSFGPFGVGLLFDEANYGYNTSVNDGITARTTIGPVAVFAFALQHNCPTGDPISCPASSVPGLGGPPGLKYYAARGTFALLPGWTVGLTYYTERFAPWRLEALGLTNSTRGTGWSADISGNLIPGVGWYFDWANWTSTFTGGQTGSAWRSGVDINLSQFGLTQWSPMLAVWYEDFGPIGAGGVPPFRNYACTLNGGAACWDWQGWGIDLTATFTPRLSGGVMYESGTVQSISTSRTELWVRVNYTLAPRTTLSGQYFRFQQPSGTNVTNFWRLQLGYSW